MLEFTIIEKLKYCFIKTFLILLNVFTFFLFSGSIRRHIRKYKESVYLSKLMKCDLNNWHQVLDPKLKEGRVKLKTSSNSPYSLYYTKPDIFIISYRSERVLLFSKHFKNDLRTKTIISILKDKTK